MEIKAPFMIIMSGIPGSGKSLFSELIAPGLNAVVCNTDKFFIDENGVYQFDVNLLGRNHQLNLEKAEKNCQLGINVIVDNTNCDKKNYGKYEKMAEEYGYPVFHLYLKPNPPLSKERNIHDVPESTIDRFASYLVWDFMEYMPEERQKIINGGIHVRKGLKGHLKKIYYKYIKPIFR